MSFNSHPPVAQASSANHSLPPVQIQMPASPLPVVPHPCDICGSFYGSEADLAEHTSHRHPAPVSSTLICPLVGCTISVGTESELVSHIVSSHSASSQPQPIPSNNSNVPSTILSPVFASMAINNVPGASMLSCLAQPPALTQAQPGFFKNPWGWGNQMKSGQDRLCNQKPKAYVLWPDECIDCIFAKQTFAYKDLFPSALGVGCVYSLFRTPEFYQCPKSVQVYLHHVSYIFHCMSYSNNTKAILNFHASILEQVEAGLITWSKLHDQTFTMQGLNFRAGLKYLSPATGSSNENNKKRDEQNKWKSEVNRVVCPDFKVGKCSQVGDHNGKWHVCHYCWWLRNLPDATYSPSECPSDPR